MNPWVRAFIGGFLATLIFHQGVWALLHLAAAVPPPFNMAPTQPFGVPKVISLAFWGGVWGLPIWWLIRHSHGPKFWLKAAAFGALGPSLVALAIVVPLKGGAFMAGWNPKFLVGALILNAAWGIGLALYMKLTAKR